MRKKNKIVDVVLTTVAVGGYIGLREALKKGKKLAAVLLGLGTVVSSGIIYSRSVNSTIESIEDWIYEFDDDDED